MCTVTFIPNKDGIFLTSNRDEKSTRKKALPPAVIQLSSGKVLFPRDQDANGTWIAVHERGDALVLLNGAFEAHCSEPPYKKSRGILVIELFENNSILHGFDAASLEKIEPFTLIIWEDGQLYEARWDGREKYLETLNHKIPQIWSSATIYNKSQRETKNSWFNAWVNNFSNPEFQDVMDFHEFSGDGTSENNLNMNRDNLLFTVSITSVFVKSEMAKMFYKDMISESCYVEKLDLHLSIPIHV
jgi:hypothetical protein